MMDSSYPDSELLYNDEEPEMEEKLSEEPLFCRLCDKTFSNRESLNVHYTHTHRDKPQYECHDCGLIFTVKRELATHRRIHSGIITRQTSYVCQRDLKLLLWAPRAHGDLKFLLFPLLLVCAYNPSLI